MRKRKVKIRQKLGKAIPIALVLMVAIGVGAETIGFFYRDSVTVTSNPILKVNGALAESVTTASNISLNASETAWQNYTVEYVGKLNTLDIGVVQTNGMIGINHTIFLDGVQLNSTTATLTKDTVHQLGVRFDGSYNLASGEEVYELTFEPTPQ
jgi:hypothetical protein